MNRFRRKLREQRGLRRERAVSRAEFGDDWPFTAPEGTLAVDAYQVTFTTGNKIYGLNGQAQAAGHPDPEPIRVRDGARFVSLKPLIDTALEMQP